MRFFIKDGVVYDMTTRAPIVPGLTPEYVCDALNEKWQREDAPVLRVEIPAGAYTVDELQAFVGATIPGAHVIKNIPVPSGSGNTAPVDPDGRAEG